MKVEWNDTSSSLPVESPSTLPGNTDCPNRTFCIEPMLVRNFVITSLSAGSMPLQCNAPLCLCNETAKASFQLALKNIMGNSTDEYINDTNVKHVTDKRFAQIKNLMKSRGLNADAVQEIATGNKVITKNHNCSLVFVKGIAHYQSKPSNESSTSPSPYLFEKGNNLTVCINETKISILPEINLNTTSVRGKIMMMLPKKNAYRMRR